MWRRHQLIITTLSLLAKRFNQCHRANFRSPLAPVPSPFRPLPPPPTSPAYLSLPLAVSLARAYQGGSSAGNYVVHDRNAGGSRNLSVSRLDAPPEIAIPIPLPSPRPPPRPSPVSRIKPGPALMTLENRSSRSLAQLTLCHSSLSYAPLIARYLSLRVHLFTTRRTASTTFRGFHENRAISPDFTSSDFSDFGK